MDLECFSLVCGYCYMYVSIFSVPFTLSLPTHASVSAMHLKIERCNPSLNKMWL
uniref:Uncharacterized protein n=1 Tax=Arundo donax TaxID=35708 RepID=A0A0A9B816_ARUDO